MTERWYDDVPSAEASSEALNIEVRAAVRHRLGGRIRRLQFLAIDLVPEFRRSEAHERAK